MVRKREKSFLSVFWIGYLAYSSIYVARLNFSVASTILEAGGVLDKTQIGVIGSIFSFVYAVSKIPNGYVGDRFSTKKVIILGLLITSLSNLLIGIFPYFWSIAVLWGLNAYGQSMLWGPMLRTFSECCDGPKFKKVSQLLVSSVAAGSIAGLLLATRCGSAGQAAACFLLPGGVTLAMALGIKMFFADAPGHMAEGRGGIGPAFRAVWGEKRFRQMIFPAMAHGLIKDNINVWLAIYFIDTFRIDLKTMAGYVFMIPALAFLGRLFYPIAYKIWKNEYFVSIFSFLICAVAALTICLEGIRAPVAMLCLGIISAVVAMINTHMLSGFPALFSGDGNLSFAASSMDLLTYGGAGLGSLCFGVMIQRFGYRSMFLTWGIVSVISALFLRGFCVGEKDS